jgi:glycogen(starch) synthase
VVDLADAIPRVLARHPGCRFRFIGRSTASPLPGVDMQTYLQRRLAGHAGAVEFTGARPPGEIARLLGETDILVAPSHWESFGLVCNEGMAAARLVIGSQAGGMAELIEPERSGLLVPPKDPAALADAIARGLEDRALRLRCGEAARTRVVEVLSAPGLLDRQIAAYRLARERLAISRP